MVQSSFQILLWGQKPENIFCDGTVLIAVDLYRGASSETVHPGNPTRPSEKGRSALGSVAFPWAVSKGGGKHALTVVMSCGRIMSDDFESLDAIEKAGIEGALNRCRGLAAQIASELRNKRPEHFVDKLSLADLCVSLEQAADVLGQKGRQPVDNTPAPGEKGLRPRQR
jgi:hypothetical protein